MGNRARIPSQRALMAKETAELRRNQKGTKAKAVTIQNSGRKSWADEVEEVTEKQRKKSSVWDNFDIAKISNAGYKLEYVQPRKIGENQIIEIEVDDTSSEVEYWKNAVICYVLGAHPPFTVIQGYIQRIWGKHGVDRIVMLKNGVIVVRFDTAIGKQEVIEGGIYHFDNKPLIVKGWTPELEFTKEELLTVPIWIKLPDLDFKYWSQRVLSKIGSLIGKPLMVDQNTEKRIGLKFARLLVEVEMNTKLPDKISFKNEKGNIVEQEVTYDWKPSLCKHCFKYGHEEDVCRIKKKNQKIDTINKTKVVANIQGEKQDQAQNTGQDNKETQKTGSNEGMNNAGKEGKKKNQQYVIKNQWKQKGKEGEQEWQTPHKCGKIVEVQQKQMEESNSFQILNKHEERIMSTEEQEIRNVGGTNIPHNGDG
ncbi:PREDICTED: uncharacterized protein LOC109217410 [Nicotiana attenuata]|uniref:uncharacterized protein LOC109217410 n=1 Tax=Nicotiana attenuata TaxID=49451 RepID=UPI000905464D|nr:PREDICTED: uncharacterized protein LOC109217410 [Nicotiana attenuata]